MLFKTRGIVLHHINYSDTSIIAYLYTEQFGRQAYLVKGARNRKASIRASLFQPLFLLDMEVYYKANHKLQKIKEARNTPVFSSLPYHQHKRAIGMFLAELLYRTLKEEESNPALFGFLFHNIQLLDITGANTANFHLFFLIGLAKYLGFYPRNNYSEVNCIFDLKNGMFIPHKPLHTHFFEPEMSNVLHQLLIRQRFQDQHNDIPGLGRIRKSDFLVKLVEYYQLHLEGMGPIKSLEVLTNVFH